MSHKILYFDTETTGLNPITCGLIQFSCIIEVDGKPLSKGNMHIAPFHTDLVEPSALANWFKKCNDHFLGSFINWIKIDPLPFLHHMHFTGKLNLPNYKLATVCKHYNIPLTAHDAMSDIEATRTLIVDKLKLTTFSHQNS